MGRTINDNTGRIFANLEVIKKTDLRNSIWEVLLECKCLVCGDTAHSTSSDLRRGRRGYCKTCRDKIAKESPLKCLYGNYKRQAEKRGYIFELTIERFEELIKMDCHYCKSEPMQVFKKKNAREGIVYNGIDRKDNDIGYTVENAVPCCKFCNLAKNTFPLEEFLAWLERVRK